MALAFPLLPPPTSWFPGHMSQFMARLPSLLTRTDIILELRDARLPLTSINENLEVAIRRWQRERGKIPGVTEPASERRICERIVVLNKSDLVPKWGRKPFHDAMRAKFPDQRMLLSSITRPRDIAILSSELVKIRGRYPYAVDVNVLVVGMPNVGKSTLLNALRNAGVPGKLAKALQTSAHPGMTRTLSTRLRIAEGLYAYDSPGVMLPYIGRGERGAERGVKLALIAGIREGLYDVQPLAAYLLYRLNVLSPKSPAYLPLLHHDTLAQVPITSLDGFLRSIATRMGMLKKGGEFDIARAAEYFIKWWRDGAMSYEVRDPPNPEVSGVPFRIGWNLDFEWESQMGGSLSIQQHMETCIEMHIRGREEEEREGGGCSDTQRKKKNASEMKAKIANRSLEKSSLKHSPVVPR